nr:MAG TPA: hypothetical protein [Caudoviricetes sp.]
MSSFLPEGESDLRRSLNEQRAQGFTCKFA